ncbi:MAG: hypothetical protein RL211_1396 [Pseudomonadota bacterium]
MSNQIHPLMSAASAAPQVQPPWADPNLPPDQFLYERKGPWPQPAPAYPIERPPEVLSIPTSEYTTWWEMIGTRLAGAYAVEKFLAPGQAQADLTRALPTDPEFVQLMTQTVYARYLRCEANGSPYWLSNFTAMELIDPLPQTYCAPVVCRFMLQSGAFICVSITFLKTTTRKEDLVVRPADKAWNLAKVYACQGAAYHALFVVHPALHFPMDSVNAITKTAVPQIHPLFQALFPHTTYTLTLDNEVLEGKGSIVNDNPPETPYDPLTGKGYNLKQLFGVGYAGYKGLDAYPPYDYMKPWMDTNTRYGKCLQQYFKAFLVFAKQIANVIPLTDPYVKRWADYCSVNVQGFPDGEKIFESDNLARAIAIYLWDVTVAHGADHYSFAYDIELKDKFLRIRRPPPDNVNEGAEVLKVGDVANLDDMIRAELANAIFFKVVTLPPNLIDTTYAFKEPALQKAVVDFHANLSIADADVRAMMPTFMRLEPESSDPLSLVWTIPASIQF